MSIDKTLNSLQNIIHETLPELELFVDGNIHPTTNDCEKLQKQLFLLQEQLSVYKHLKTNKEISPSFDIHAKVSEAAADKNIISQVDEVKPVHKEIIAESKTETSNKTIETKTEITDQTSVNKANKKLEIPLNDKFRFINDLFKQNTNEYSLAVDQLNNCSGWNDAEIYLNSLKSIYDWKDSNDTYKRFKEITKKRFE